MDVGIFYLLFLKVRMYYYLEPVYNYNIGSSDQSVNIDNMRARRAATLKGSKKYGELL